MTLPRLSPMLAVSWEAPFDSDEWLFDAKYDGVRALVSVDSGGVDVRSRAGNDMTHSYPELTALLEVGPGTILDGEIIAYDDAGIPSFERLQGRMHRSGPSTIPITFLVFDLLASEGKLRLEEPIEDRLERLRQIDLPTPCEISLSIVADGTALHAATAERGMEGIVAKRLGSRYRPGERSPDWRKIPHVLRTRAVVGGYTESEGAGAFGALLLGMWTADRLRFVGSVGTGYDQAGATAIRAALDQMTLVASPFADDPAIPTASFVYPHLVAEIAFKQWTAAGRLRAPSFKGISDRQPETVTWEAEGPNSLLP